MSRPYEGTFLWIWESDQVLGGNAAAMVQQLKSLGVTGVILKYSDGSLVGDPVSQKFMADFKRIAPILKQAGFKIGGWTYQYLTDVAGEVDAAAQAITAGADFIVLDAEKDVAGKTAQVQQYGQLLRQKYPNIPVGLSSYAIADYHKEVPFDAYNAFVDMMMPQVYWATMGWDVAVAFNASIASYKKYGKPIAPTGQAYDKATAADMARFVQLCKNAEYTHLSWWDWQHMTADHLDGVKTNIIKTPAPVVTQPIPTSAATQPTTPQVVAKDISDNAWYAEAVKYAIQEGIMSLDENGNFNPDQPVTRSMLAQVTFNERHQKA